MTGRGTRYVLHAETEISARHFAGDADRTPPKPDPFTDEAAERMVAGNDQAELETWLATVGHRPARTGRRRSLVMVDGAAPRAMVA